MDYPAEGLVFDYFVSEPSEGAGFWRRWADVLPAYVSTGEAFSAIQVRARLSTSVASTFF